MAMEAPIIGRFGYVTSMAIKSCSPVPTARPTEIGDHNAHPDFYCGPVFPASPSLALQACVKANFATKSTRRKPARGPILELLNLSMCNGRPFLRIGWYFTEQTKDGNPR